MPTLLGGCFCFDFGLWTLGTHISYVRSCSLSTHCTTCRHASTTHNTAILVPNTDHSQHRNTTVSHLHSMPPPRLHILHAPAISSRLAVPTTPFTPLSPLSPLFFLPISASYSPPQTKSSSSTFLSSLLPVPQTPLTWQWTCHACHTPYALGATRRCLEDGHFFCAGESVVRRRGKTRRRKHKACGSAFDYTGWKRWGRWKRTRRTASHIRSGGGRYMEEQGGEKGTVKQKGCWQACDYPSQCRWGKSVGVHTPSPTPTRTTFPTDLFLARNTPLLTLDTAVPNVSTLDGSSTLQASLLSSCVPSLPSLDECFATSPSHPSLQSTSRSGSDSNLSPSIQSSAPRGLEDVDMVDAGETALLVPSSHSTLSPSSDYGPATTRRGDACIDPALLTLSCNTNVYAVAVPARG